MYPTITWYIIKNKWLDTNKQSTAQTNFEAVTLLVCRVTTIKTEGSRRGLSGQSGVDGSGTHWGFTSGNWGGFPQRAASLQLFTSLLLFVYFHLILISWSLIFGGLTLISEVLLLRLTSEQKSAPGIGCRRASNRSTAMKSTSNPASPKCQLFRKGVVQFSVCTSRRFGVYLRGFRRISSDEKLKDLLRPERIKKSFSSIRESGKTFTWWRRYQGFTQKPTKQNKDTKTKGKRTESWDMKSSCV